MLVDIQQKLLSTLTKLKVPFTVVKGNKDISDFVEVEIADSCLGAVEEQQNLLEIIRLTIVKTRA